MRRNGWQKKKGADPYVYYIHSKKSIETIQDTITLSVQCDILIKKEDTKN